MAEETRLGPSRHSAQNRVARPLGQSKAVVVTADTPGFGAVEDHRDVEVSLSSLEENISTQRR